MNSQTRSEEKTDSAQDRFAAAYKANFGRGLTSAEAKAFLGELKDRARASASEVMAAIRAVADKRMDEPQRDPPTAPQLAREILQARSRSGGMVGEETFEQAVEKIAAEPDPSLRYSLFCNRGGSDALLAALASRGVELAIYGPGHPDWAWMKALMADPEWRNLDVFWPLFMVAGFDDDCPLAESVGAKRLHRADFGDSADDLEFVWHNSSFRRVDRLVCLAFYHSRRRWLRVVVAHDFSRTFHLWACYRLRCKPCGLRPKSMATPWTLDPPNAGSAVSG